MAIVYDLEFAAPATVDQLAAAFVGLGIEGGLLPPTTSPEDLTGDGVELRAGMLCVAGEEDPDDLPAPNPLTKYFGLVPRCWVAFRVDTSRDVDAEDDEMVWMTQGLLRRLAGDAALSFQGEVLWLVRKGGRLLVSDRDDMWTPERLAMLPQPYERAHLVFSDVPEG